MTEETKNPVGRPPKYTDPEEMQVLIDLYFLACKTNKLADLMGFDDDKHGLMKKIGVLLKDLNNEHLKIVDDIDDVHPTVTGLALVLDLTRKSLIDYEVDKKFVYTVKRAKLRIENHVEQRLFYNNAVGPIFNLKNNFEWREKQETELSGGLSIAKIQREIVDPKDPDS